MNTSIIIPCWNSLELLKKNLKFVMEAKENKNNKIIEIIVVDDASNDDSVNFLETKYGKDIKLIKLTNNRGFSGTVNMGVRSAKGDLVCLLNTDVSPSINFLEAIYNHFENEKMFGVSLHEKGYGGAIAKFTNGFFDHRGLPEKEEAYRSFWVSGGSGVFRKKIWKELQGLDEALFSPFYWEDLDICYRAMKRGYVCMWEPKSMVLHNHESVINTDNFNKKYLQIIRERNELLFIWKNITSKRLFRKHIKALTRKVMSHPGYLRVVRAAILEYENVKRLRTKEISESTVSDEAIFAVFQK